MIKPLILLSCLIVASCGGGSSSSSSDTEKTPETVKIDKQEETEPGVDLCNMENINKGKPEGADRYSHAVYCIDQINEHCDFSRDLLKQCLSSSDLCNPDDADAQSNAFDSASSLDLDA